VAALAALLVPAALALSADTKPPLSLFFSPVPYYYEGDALAVAMTVKTSPTPYQQRLDLTGTGGGCRGAKLKPKRPASC
jgi:hypothetical protein